MQNASPSIFLPPVNDDADDADHYREIFAACETIGEVIALVLKRAEDYNWSRPYLFQGLAPLVAGLNQPDRCKVAAELKAWGFAEDIIDYIRGG
jgi:hypothetical protein